MDDKECVRVGSTPVIHKYIFEIIFCDQWRNSSLCRSKVYYS